MYNKSILILLIVSSTLVFGSPSLFNNRIQGGRETEIEEVPYQAGLYYMRQLACGGSILNQKFIVTAAHCSVPFLDSAYIIVGNKTKNKGPRLQIERIHVHPEYDDRVIANDVAIVELKEPLVLSNTIKNILLPNIGETVPTGSLMRVSGWGSMYHGGNTVQSLRSTLIPFVDRNMCQELYKGDVVDETMVCAGFESGGTNTCTGDSGGPLVHNGKLFGIVSWAFKCAQPKHPSVFTNVSHPSVRNFITKITGI